MIEHVIERCQRAGAWLSKQPEGILCRVVLLVPKGDDLESLSGNFDIITGSEPDVLSRYVNAAAEFYPDYICRITGDCPLIPEFVISSIIRMAIRGRNDYTSNTIPEYRTAIDGHDCEVISSRMLQWLDNNAVTPNHREHVTTRIMEDPPHFARIHPVIGYYDLSDIKLSVDTAADMDAARAQYNSVAEKIAAARARGYSVGRL